MILMRGTFYCLKLTKSNDFLDVTRCSTTLASKVNSPDAVNFRKALCDANLVTYPADSRGDDTRVLHRVLQRSGEADLTGCSSHCKGTSFTRKCRPWQVLSSKGEKMDMTAPILCAAEREVLD